MSEVFTELPRIMRGERVITIDPHYDLSAHMLGHITTQLEREVLGTAE